MKVEFELENPRFCNGCPCVSERFMMEIKADKINKIHSYNCGLHKTALTLTDDKTMLIPRLDKCLQEDLKRRTNES